MMKITGRLLGRMLAICGLLVPMALLAQRETKCRWDFEDLDGWVYGHLDTASRSMCYVEDGMLRIDTRAHTYDRQKMHTRGRIYQSGMYRAQWITDGDVKQDRQLEFGEEIPFYIFCSVENLKFLGERMAEHDNYGLFDWVTFEGHSR